MEDKVGLDRSVLSYIDVGLQPKGKYFLIIDEGMGQKALFSVDSLNVGDKSITAYRGDDVVVQFSHALPWRIITSSVVYLQDSRTIYEREIVEQKELHDLTKQVRQQLRPDDDETKEDRVPGQYV